MKAIEFPEVNVRIGANQPQYQTIPAHVNHDEEQQIDEVFMCFEFDEAERKQIAETGQIWHTVLMPARSHFHPIRMDVTKPEMK
ncbi:MAG: hypothetical protein AB2L20_11795 [Mangrovibacterium sp.]